MTFFTKHLKIVPVEWLEKSLKWLWPENHLIFSPFSTINNAEKTIDVHRLRIHFISAANRGATATSNAIWHKEYIKHRKNVLPHICFISHTTFFEQDHRIWEKNQVLSVCFQHNTLSTISFISLIDTQRQIN